MLGGGEGGCGGREGGAREALPRLLQDQIQIVLAPFQVPPPLACGIVDRVLRLKRILCILIVLVWGPDYYYYFFVVARYEKASVIFLPPPPLNL